MARFTTLSNRNEYYATDFLIERAKERVGMNERILAVSYTNYGGTFYDKCLIGYIKENYPNNIITEITSYNGENAFVFGDVLELEDFDSNGFTDSEDFEEYMDSATQAQIGEECSNIIGSNPEYANYQNVIKDFLGNRGVDTSGIVYIERELNEYIEKRIFDDIVGGKNFMTPCVLELKRVGKYIIEISASSHDNHRSLYSDPKKVMYGFTAIQWNGKEWERAFDIDFCTFNREEIDNKLSILADE